MPHPKKKFKDMLLQTVVCSTTLSLMTYWINIYQAPDGWQGFGFFRESRSPYLQFNEVYRGVFRGLHFVGRWRITLKPHVRRSLVGLTPEML